MNNNLEVLADPKNHDNLLLAEAVAWLHDMGKCDERHLQQSASDYIGRKPYKYKTEHSHLVGSRNLELLGESVPLKQLIEESLHRYSEDAKKPWLVRTLAFCHGAAHTEKEEAYYLLQQTIADTRRSSSFGYESEPLVDLKTRLDKLPEQLSDSSIPFNRSKFKASVEEAFGYAVGDTRRPINEVTLWDWSSIVAALYKAALAGALLGYKKDPPNIHWRLLSVRLNGAAFSERVARIPDLLVRQKLTSNGLNRVRTLLEEMCPLGTEVYRDEDGSIFIVPSIDNLRDLVNEQGEKLSGLIVHEFSAGTIDERSSLQLGGEIIPFLELDEIPWSRKGPRIIPQHQHQPPLPIINHVMKVPLLHADSHIVSSWWQSHSEDICTVCQLRPQGWQAPDLPAYKNHYDRRARGDRCPPSCQICKALARKVCVICEQRREDRSKQWAEKELNTTIWIDEIADVNGRLALVVGKFGMEHWLDGEMLFYPGIQQDLFIESLKVNVVVKSVERLRDGHYRLVLDDPLSGLAVSDSCLIHGREFQVVKVTGDGSQVKTASDGAVKVVEDQILHPGRLIGEQYFEPLEIVETQTPARLHRVWETTLKFWEGIKSNFKTSVGEVNPRLQMRGTFLPEADPSETLGVYHTYELKLGNVNLSIACVKEGEFLTVDNLERVAILLNPSEKPPQDYPAAANFVRKALTEDRIRNVEEPTGYGSPNKILGKLQITGEVTLEQMPYIPSISILTEPRTFMAIVPADKALKVAKFIKKKYEEEMDKVRNRLPITVGVVFAGRRTPLPAILDAGRRMLKQPTQDERWIIEKVEPPLPRSSWPSEVTLTLERGGQYMSIKVQTVMGDKTTRDEWYPFWRMESPISNEWVYICDLQKGDVVHLMPSRFDFEFLDTAARRFEISYANDKRRGSYHPSRPYYLEQFEDFDKESMWKTLSDNLAASQIENLVGIIETKRTEWVAHQDKGIFERMVRDTLNNANWKPRPEQEKFEQLYSAALSGQLADVVEVYIRILKGENESTIWEEIHG